jgi:hypothetical protein
MRKIVARELKIQTSEIQQDSCAFTTIGFKMLLQSKHFLSPGAFFSPQERRVARLTQLQAPAKQGQAGRHFHYRNHKDDVLLTKSWF